MARRSCCVLLQWWAKSKCRASRGCRWALGLTTDSTEHLARGVLSIVWRGSIRFGRERATGGERCARRCPQGNRRGRTVVCQQATGTMDGSWQPRSYRLMDWKGPSIAVVWCPSRCWVGGIPMVSFGRVPIPMRHVLCLMGIHGGKSKYTTAALLVKVLFQRGFRLCKRDYATMIRGHSVALCSLRSHLGVRSCLSNRRQSVREP